MLCRLLRLLRLIDLLIGDHQVGKAKSRVAGVIGLEGSDGLLDSSRQSIGVSKMAQIVGGIVRAEGQRSFALRHGFFGIPPRRRERSRPYSPRRPFAHLAYQLSGPRDGEDRSSDFEFTWVPGMNTPDFVLSINYTW